MLIYCWLKYFRHLKCICKFLVDGGWRDYSEYNYTTCSETCGGGVKTKTRYCDDPKPNDYGDLCNCDQENANQIFCNGTMATIQIECNGHECPGILNQYIKFLI